MFNPNLFQQLLISLAILTSTGTLVQETKVGRALAVSPLAEFSINLTSHLDGMNEATGSHSTHVEQPMSKFQMSTGDAPQMQARNEHRKYATPKSSSRSETFTGGSQVLWPSV